MIDKVLIKVLLLDGNEASSLSDVVYLKFRELITELTKIKYDIRYCNKMMCACHPEFAITDLLKDAMLERFLKSNDVLCDIRYLLNNYKPITVYDKKYMSE